MQEIRFGGQLTEEDFRRIQSVAMRKIYAILVVIFAVMLVMTLASGGWREFATNPRAAFVTWLPVVVFIPLLAAIQWFVIRRHWRNNKTIHRPVQGAVSDEAITWNVQDVGSLRFAWDLLLKYRETHSLVLVYQSPNQVLYFPRHYFADENEWETFRALVRAKLPAA